jgi:hypothetical protein
MAAQVTGSAFPLVRVVVRGGVEPPTFRFRYPSPRTRRARQLRSVQSLWRSGATWPIDAARAGQVAAAFEPPLSYAQVHTAGFYGDAGVCDRSDVPYC